MINSKGIISAVSRIYGGNILVQRGQRARGAKHNPRFFAIKLIRDELKISLPGLGRLFGVTHSTIWYNLNTIEAEMKGDQLLRAEYESLVNTIRGLSC